MSYMYQAIYFLLLVMLSFLLSLEIIKIPEKLKIISTHLTLNMKDRILLQLSTHLTLNMKDRILLQWSSSVQGHACHLVGKLFYAVC